MCNKDNHTTDEELDLLLPTDDEAELLGEAFARLNTECPDVDREWARLKDRTVERRHRRPRLVPAILVAAAACIAFVLILWPGREPSVVNQPVITHEVSAFNDVMLTADDGNGKPVHDAEVSFAQKGKAKPAASRLRMSTPRGKECNVTLADGTRVWLNGESSIEFPSEFKGREREVRITGEAYFEVAHDPRRPFVVKSDYYSITVLGTTFNARAYSKTDAGVVLVEGSLKVAAPQGSSEQTLTPGTQATLRADGDILVAEVDTYPYIQRRNGFFYFDNESLLNIMLELGRWYNKTVVFENQNVMRTKLHFVAERDQSLINVLKSLCELDNIDIQLTDDDITIR